MNKWVTLGILLIIFTSGCIEEKTPVITTTTITPTTTTEIITTTTKTTETITTTEETIPTTVPKRCRFLNFQIKSHSYRNDELTLYFNNIGSESIDNFDVYLYFTNKTSTESFTDQGIAYHVTKKYVLDVGPGLDNITVVETACGKSYYVNV